MPNKNNGWELVPRRVRVMKKPMITLSKCGVITFSTSCAQKFELHKYNYAHIYHNEVEKALGFRFIPAYEKDAMTVRKYNEFGMMSISCRVLLTELGFYKTKTQSFEASRYDGMIVINYG